MRHRSSARWLAPLALVLCALAVAAVVGEALRPEQRASTATGAAAGTAQTKAVSDSGERRRSKRKSYRVRSGDTLTAISVRTGVPLARLQELNPKLDFDALQTGQKIKLSP